MCLLLVFVNILLSVLSLAGKTHQPPTLCSHRKHVDALNVKRSDNVTISSSLESVSYRSADTNPPYHMETYYEGEDFFKYVFELPYVSVD